MESHTGCGRACIRGLAFDRCVALIRRREAEIGFLFELDQRLDPSGLGRHTVPGCRRQGEQSGAAPAL